MRVTQLQATGEKFSAEGGYSGFAGITFERERAKTNLFIFALSLSKENLSPEPAPRSKTAGGGVSGEAVAVVTASPEY